MKAGVWAAGIGLTLGLGAPASAQSISSSGSVEAVLAEGVSIIVRIGCLEQRVSASPDATVTLNSRPADLVSFPTTRASE